ncbi:hypothetical protein Hanom_Chr13g01228211 [Helianthus anomalus]
MTIQTMNGVSLFLEMRSERVHGGPRYAFKGWERFTREVGLVSGRAYSYERVFLCLFSITCNVDKDVCSLTFI